MESTEIIKKEEIVKTSEDNKKNEEKNKNKQIFSQNLQFFRKNMNISQKEMAEKLNTTNKNISKWENAETVPDVFMVKKIADIFNITIDTLISPITNDNKIAIKTKNVRPFRLKIYSLLFVNCIIFLLACVAFYTLKSFNITGFNLYYLFLYILPIMDLSVFIFICIVAKKADPISLSIFGWLVSICIYLSFINAPNINYIFIITIAYQILAIVLTRLINSNKIIKLNQIIISKLKRKDEKETGVTE